ncbi:MAG: PHP domain-containing protein [Chloroflexi bacterium]|nr:PHP domain-containing protein [Chloroflexota bacterium]
MSQPQLIRAEFHCHTVYSHDSSNRIPQLLQAAQERGIERLAITDHNTIQGALKAKELDPQRVVVGEEILTTHGELLGYFLENEIPRRLSPMETIERLKGQGAFIVVPHVFDRRRHGWRREDLEQILPHVDALEVFNARCLSPRTNRLGRAFADQRGFAMIAGSDAHSVVELGLASVWLPAFNDPDELRDALKNSRIDGRLLSPLDHFKASALIASGRINPLKKR